MPCPTFRIGKKEILYQSEVYFTPLLSENAIDIPAVVGIIEAEFGKSGLKKKRHPNRAVIITGESARKGNAKVRWRRFLNCRGFCGHPAGPQLEAVFAGHGSERAIF